MRTISTMRSVSLCLSTLVFALVACENMAHATEARIGFDGQTNSAIPENCGDGMLQPDEQCDDGNTVSGDGCSEACEKESLPVSGVCCLSFGVCEDALTKNQCEQQLGRYLANNLTCAESSFDCLEFVGGCCLPNGTCEDEWTLAKCSNAGGQYLGAQNSCSQVGNKCGNVEQPGACCLENSCAEMTQSDCQAAMGVFSGEGSICNEFTCSDCATPEPTGACCIEGQCLLLSAQACFTNGGLYAGDGSQCTAGVCDCQTPNGCCDELAAGCSVTPGQTQHGASIFATLLAALSATFFARRRGARKEA